MSMFSKTCIKSLKAWLNVWQDPNRSNVLQLLLKYPESMSKIDFSRVQKSHTYSWIIREISDDGHHEPAGKPKLLQNQQVTLKAGVQQAQQTELCAQPTQWNFSPQER